MSGMDEYYAFVRRRVPLVLCFLSSCGKITPSKQDSPDFYVRATAPATVPDHGKWVSPMDTNTFKEAHMEEPNQGLGCLDG